MKVRLETRHYRWAGVDIWGRLAQYGWFDREADRRFLPYGEETQCVSYGWNDHREEWSPQEGIDELYDVDFVMKSSIVGKMGASSRLIQPDWFQLDVGGDLSSISWEEFDRLTISEARARKFLRDLWVQENGALVWDGTNTPKREAIAGLPPRSLVYRGKEGQWAAKKEKDGSFSFKSFKGGKWAPTSKAHGNLISLIAYDQGYSSH
jgi:hypothetical protein